MPYPTKTKIEQKHKIRPTVASAERWWVEQAREDPYYFIWYVTGHKPAKHHQIWLSRMFHPDKKRLNIVAPRESAKAQPLSAKILTPDGWTTMGELRVGDCVISEDGTPTTVLGVFPQGQKQIYKATFTDGSSTRSTGDHLWKVRLLSAKDDNTWRTETLDYIRTTRRKSKSRGTKMVEGQRIFLGSDIYDEYHSEDSYLDSRQQARYHIPVMKPLQLPSKDFFISPYIMGVLLGDGTFRTGSVQISSSDSEIIASVAAELPVGYEIKPKDRYDYTIYGAGRGNPSKVREQLSTYGLWKKNSAQKFIPEEYFWGSVAQREALLQGLLDTDGTVGSNARKTMPTYCTVSLQLSQDVIRLVRSLGGTATETSYVPSFTYKGEKKQGQRVYRVRIKLPSGLKPFRLLRKAAVYEEPTKYPVTRGILKIEEDGFEEAQCILVNHPEHTYVTDDFIVTHNTTISVYALAWLMAKYPLLTFGIVAVSSTVAKDRLAMLRQLFGDNARFKNVFPWIHIDLHRPDTQDEFTLYSDYNGMPYNIWKTSITTNRSELVKNPSIFASGNGGKGIIGRRISGVLLMDDMVDDSFLSDDLQTKMMKYIASVLEPCAGEVGRIWNIGTRWMVNDIYERLMGNAAWTTILIPAIIEDENGNRFSYWPGFWPLKRLEEKRIAMDDDLLFRIMYLCDPTAITAQLFAAETLTRDIPEYHPPFVDVYVIMDTATSMKTYADWNVIYIAGVDKDRNVYLMDGVRFKDETEETIEKIIQMCDAAYLIYDKLTACLIEHVNAEGTFLSLLNSRRPDLPVRGVKLRSDKMQRAKQVSYWGIKGKLYINQKLPFIDNLRSEWANFPVHKHDDTLDPVSMLFQELQFGRVQAALLTVNLRAIRAQRRMRK